jgi:hypothetical protein
MRNELIILSSELTKKGDRNLYKLAEHFGLRPCLVHCDSAGNIRDKLDCADRCQLTVAMSARLLGLFVQAPSFNGIENHPFFSSVELLLLYDFQPSLLSDKALRHISSGAINSVYRFNTNNHCYKVSSNLLGLVHELGGMSVAPIDNNIDYGFVCPDSNGDFDPIISIDEKPLFIYLRKNGLTCFLIANTQILDIDEEWSKEVRVEDYFSRFVPYAIFIKHAFGKYCWHNNKRYANFIIDDPLLKKQYGLLDFNRLIRLIRAKKFKTTLAFIPWNYWRTDNKSADFFRENHNDISLCIHGCDHSGGEFGSTDLASLMRKASWAIARMERHERRTGIGYERIMVFPQGYFSTAALKALKKNKYLAAINSSIFPVNEERLKASDFLDLALNTFCGFPVFQRRYSNNLTSILLDIFLGKPALIAEHHSYFKNSDRSIGEFIDRLNTTCSEMRWESLSEIAMRSYLTKQVDDAVSCCRIYTDEAIIENDDDSEKTFMIIKREDDEIKSSGVLINGEHSDYCMDNNFIKISHKIAPRKNIRISIRYEQETGEIPPPRLRSSPSTFARRFLSELRDEYLSKNEFILNKAHELRSFIMKKTN